MCVHLFVGNCAQIVTDYFCNRERCQPGKMLPSVFATLWTLAARHITQMHRRVIFLVRVMPRGKPLLDVIFTGGQTTKRRSRCRGDDSTPNQLMNDLRIVSFLPAATEMICSLGLDEQLVGISHECDYPPEVRNKPVVVRPALPLEGMSQREIDEAVTRLLREGRSLYVVDEELLRELSPDLIVTQDLCQVCAPSGNELVQAVKSLAKTPHVLSLTPKSLDGIFQNIREIGVATDRVRDAETLIEASRARLEQITVIAETSGGRPRVFCIEWLDPVYCSGHWVPEMVEIAGGLDSLSRRRADSVRIPWEEVQRWQPEVLILMPCGYRLNKILELVPQVFAYPGWSDLPAVRNGRVFAVDANAFFARPGPRVVEGTALLAHLIHPELFVWNGAGDAFASISAAPQ